jgi:hypothetical protein
LKNNNNSTPATVVLVATFAYQLPNPTMLAVLSPYHSPLCRSIHSHVSNTIEYLLPIVLFAPNMVLGPV